MTTKQDRIPWEEELKAVAENRRREDFDLEQAYTQKYQTLRSKLVNLYDRRSNVQNELGTIAQSIRILEADQEHLSQEWDATVARVQGSRAKEDRDHEARIAAHERERAAALGAGRPQTNGHPPAGQPAGGWTSINGTRGRKSVRDDDEELPTDPGNLLSSGYQQQHTDDSEANGRPLPYRTNGPDMDLDEADPSLALRSRPLKPKQQQQQQRHSLPGFHSEATRDSPVKSERRSPSGRRSLPGARSHSQANDTPNPVDQIEINRDTLALKHNGTVYTEPPMYAGVPVERITPEHEYWDKEWVPLEDHLKPQLEQWQTKLDKLRQDKSAVRHTVFLANRQVNRGQAVIDFLAGPSPEFHPYQYVGKEMMSKFYKTFINYDTMFRLINVHEELKKFDLDITPLEWLRQRMYEVSTAQGDKFNLSKYTHDLYHDQKLKLLREKHGFGNIGRPSGYKVGEKNPEKGKAKLKREQLGLTGRRKGRRSIGQVDVDDTQSLDGYPQQPPEEYLNPVTPRMQKRQRIEMGGPLGMPPMQHVQQELTPQPEQPPLPIPEFDDLDADGWTSSDSFSAGRISIVDFRVYQIKTARMTTSPEVTQYWTWKSDKALFEHQVLRDVHPHVSWGVYQKHVNFDLRLTEIVEIQYCPDSLKVVIISNDTERGTVLAFFRRERTKKRFLTFLRKKSVALVKCTPIHLEDTWNNLKSETMPSEDA